MRGSITRLNKKLGCGFILAEDGCEAYFLSSLDGLDIRALLIEKRWNTRNTSVTNICGL
jgi:hypothetical protein